LLSLAVVDHLRQDVLDCLPPGREAGGVLIGTRRPGVITVLDFIPFPGDAGSKQAHFSVRSEWLNEIRARCPSDRKVLGYYRTDIDQRVQLGQDDLDSIDRWFHDPASIFLVIAPTDGPTASAAFFVWQHGSVSPNPRLTFPFSVIHLTSGDWPLEAFDPAAPARLDHALSRLAARIRSGDTRVLTGAAITATIVALLIIVFSTGWIGSTNASPPGLGLQVKRAGASFLITWNSTARAIQDAKTANLVIADPSREPFDGSKDPLFLELTPQRLRAGSMTYTSFSPQRRVRFRLDVVGPSGRLTSESLASVAPEPVPAPVETARNVTPSVRPQPVAQRVPPPRPRVHEPPIVILDKRPAAIRTFIPPKSSEPARLPGRTILTIPPELLASYQPAMPWMPLPPDPLPPPSQSDVPAAPAAAPPVSQEPKPATQKPEAPPAPAPAPVPQVRALPGLLTITSEPAGAEVQINTVPAGHTPLTIQISPVGLGFTVTVTKAGFMNWTLQTFATAQPYSLHAQLRPAPR
jgi:hypothetical protein